MQSLERSVDAIARQTTFSGVVRVDRGEEIALAKAYGLAHRGDEIPNAIDTQFGIASGTKGFTAATVVSLIVDGSLERSTTARSVLGADLPLINDDVTVELLLSHRSGIGDYLDEETDLDITDYLLPVPAHELATTEQYLAVLDGHPSKFAPGERFAYCNSGYVVLALIAERVGGEPFPELVRRRVCEPAQMDATEFLRADELPGRAAVGYLASDGTRTNVFHLPVRGVETAGSSRPLPTSAPSGAPSSRVRSCRELGDGDDSGAAATRGASRWAMGSGSGCARRPVSCCSKAAMPACRSAACTIRNARSHTP